MAETSPRLRERFGKEHAGVDVHPAYDALLERSDLDAVMIFADNRASAELGVRALGEAFRCWSRSRWPRTWRGPRPCSRPRAPAGQALMVNWPTAWRPAIRHGLSLALAGRVGEPVQLSHRGGHAGPREFGCSPEFSAWLYDPARNGGGALVDYCGYGAVLARTLLGRPRAVTAVAARLRKPDLRAEDSAVVVLRYPRALALLEASWNQVGGEPAFGMVVYGDAGTLIVHQPRATREGQRVGPGRVEVVTARGKRDRRAAVSSERRARRADVLPDVSPRPAVRSRASAPPTSGGTSRRSWRRPFGRARPAGTWSCPWQQARGLKGGSAAVSEPCVSETAREAKTMPAITGVAHAELSVRDLDVSSAWYCRLLGAREVFREPNEAEDLVACAILEPRSGMVLAFTQHLHPTEGPFDVRRVGLDHLAFGVADEAALRAWQAALDELGIPNSGIQDIRYAKSITFADPDGIPLEVFLPRARGARSR